MEAAIEYYYSMDPGQMAQFAAKSQQQPSLSRGAVEQLYNRYRDQHAQDILAEGVGRLCEDLQVMHGLPPRLALQTVSPGVIPPSSTRA